MHVEPGPAIIWPTFAAAKRARHERNPVCHHGWCPLRVGRPIGLYGPVRPAEGRATALPDGPHETGAFEAALAVLGRMHFSIDKADANAGVIRTHPLPAGQFFEFWRSDNVTLRDQVEANLHSMRRIVWITVVPRSRDLCLDCLVKVQRLNVPSRAVSSSATAYRTLSESTVYAQGLRLSPEQQKAMEWVDLGTDAALGGRILGSIQSELRTAKTGTRWR